MESKQFSDMPYDVITLQVKTMGVDVYAVLVHIVFYVNNIHIVSPSNQLITLKKSEAYQSVHHVSFILCYTVLYYFVALAFSLTRVRKLWWDDITQGNI